MQAGFSQYPANVYYPGTYRAPVPAVATVPIAPPAPTTPVWTGVSPAGFPLYGYRLANGYSILIEKRPTSVINATTFVNAGSINENPFTPSPLYPVTGFPSGLAHLDEHCHFVAQRNFPVNYTLDGILEGTGSRRNATTSDEFINHTVTFNQEEADKVLAIHGEMLANAVYRPDTIARERATVLNEIAERRAPANAQLSNRLDELFYDRNGEQTGGRDEDVAGITPQQMEAFKQRFYTPGNMVTVLSGNVDPARAVATLNQTLGTLPRDTQGPNTAALKMALRPGEVRSASIMDPQNTHEVVLMGFPSAAKTDPKGRAAMEILDTYLTSGAYSLLPSQLKERAGIVNQVYSWVSAQKGSGMLKLVVLPKPGHSQNATQAVMQAMRSLTQNPIPQDQLDRIKQQLIYATRSRMNNVESVTGHLGSEAITNSLDYALQYENLIRALTAQEIQQVAQTYLGTGACAIVNGFPGAQHATTPNTSGRAF